MADRITDPGAAERDFCVKTPIIFLIFPLIFIFCLACTADNLTSSQTDSRSGEEVGNSKSADESPSNSGIVGAMSKRLAAPQTEVLAVCNYETPVFTLAECIESFEQADKTLTFDEIFYLYGENGVFTGGTEVQIVFLDRIVPLSQAQGILRMAAVPGSWIELRIRRSLEDWSDPIRFKMNSPKTQITAVCNLHRANFTREECLASYQAAGEKLNMGEKFFVYGEDGILWEGVSVRLEYSEEILSMAEAIAKVNKGGSEKSRSIQVKRRDESWSDPIELKMDFLIPSRPSILQVCTAQMKSCTPEILERSQPPFLIDLIGLASWEQTHVWMETIVDGDINLIACYPLWLAVRNGADYCATELHSPHEFSQGEHNFQSRLVSGVGTSDWSDKFFIELEDGPIELSSTILGSNSPADLEISIFSAFSLCGKTRADSTGNWAIKVTVGCAPDGTTIKIVESFEAGVDFARTTTKFDTSSRLNQVEMPPESTGESGLDIVWTLTLLEPWGFGHLVLSDFLSSLRFEEARAYFETTLLSLVGFIETASVRPESEELKKFAEQHYDLVETLWFPAGDESQSKTESIGDDLAETPAKWTEELESYVAKRDEILLKIDQIVQNLQEECISNLDQAPDVCTEDFSLRSEWLKQKYQQIEHSATIPW